MKFTNFSNEDFTWKWDNIAYSFKAGSTVYMEDWKARHFAKHLVNRELQKENLLVSSPQRNKFLERALDAEGSEEIPVSKASTELMNKNNAPFCDQCDSKGKKHLKACPTNTPETKPDEHFEGLK